MLGLGVGFYKLSGATGMDTTSLIQHNNQNVLLDGTNDYVDADCVKGNIDSDNGTISIWVRPLEDPLATTSLVSIAADDNNMIEILYVGGTTKFRGLYRGGGSDKTVDSGATTAAEWVHIALTWDSSGDALTIYMNGNAVTVGSLPTFSGSIARVYMGGKGSAGGAEAFFKGKIDEIAFSQTILNSTQINAVTSNKSIGFIGLTTYSSLTNYYKIDQLAYLTPFTQGITDIIGSCEATLEDGAVRTITNLLPAP